MANGPTVDGSIRSDVNRRACLILVLALVAGLFLWYLLGGRMPKYDAAALYSPHFTLLADFIRSGHLLLWNPFLSGGSPDLAYPDMGGFSPLTIGLAALTGGGYFGFVLYTLTFFALAGIGFCLLAFHLRAPGWATMAVTAGIISSGFFLVNSTHTSIISAIGFLPFIVWRLDKGLVEKRWWPVIEGGAIYGLSGLCSHPQMVISSGIFLGLWAIGRSLFPDLATPDSAGRRIIRAATSLTIMLTVALIVLSPVYVNFFHETAGYTERHGFLPRAHAVSYGQLPVRALVTLASPYLSTLAVFNPDIWPGEQILLSDCYVGAIIPALALFLFLIRPRRRFAWWLAGMTVFFLMAALGSATPVRGWLYDLLPPTRFFRHASFFRPYFMFSLGVMALLASKELSSPRAWKLLSIASTALLAAATSAFLITLLVATDRGNLAAPAATQLILSWGGLTLIAIVGWKRAPEKIGGAIMVALVCLAVLDAALSLHLSSPLMVMDRSAYRSAERPQEFDYHAIPFSRSHRSTRRRTDNLHFISKTPMLTGYNQMSIRFHSSESLTPLADNWSTVPELVRAATGPDRVWFSSAAAEVSPSDATFAALVERSRKLGDIPILVSRPDEVMRTPLRGDPGPDDDANVEAIGRLPAAHRLDYQLLEYSPVRLVLGIDCPEPGWLLVTDRWTRSWTARVNGKPTPLWVGDFIFRAVRLDRGAQTVEFNYHPFMFPLLLGLSWGTLAITAGGGVFRFFRGKQVG